MKNLKICLADDDSDDRELFQEALIDLDATSELMLFKDGSEVITALPKIRYVPDFLFLDLNMPIMDGRDTLVKIRKNHRYDPLFVVIYSTSAAARDIKDCMQLGANGYLVKPTSFKALKAGIADILKVN
ncbi:response regulator [Sphingobacterium siyangense]|uniref:response regulator n=1 Tax=Sphingobacterium siyangense TaxID=459529 RepID=UPI001962A347|nr:response regulator [Sphingobacterium siyangense]QRY55497.1 response regulator [Sphingobacterium siyangense]